MIEENSVEYERIFAKYEPEWDSKSSIEASKEENKDARSVLKQPGGVLVEL